jgi:hypothetical protein
MKPNIFRLATKELSQDSFFTWLLQWADNKHKEHNSHLHETAKDFVKWLINESPDYQINKVEAARQWRNIDIWAEVNDEYFIAIEDKTNSGEHSKQLERYKKIAEEHYKGKGFKLFFIYLKTGNESSSTLKKISEKGYTIINRKNILDILNGRKVENEIFSEFKEYLTSIETQTNSYTEFKKITSDWRAAEGFYIKLQDLINEWTDWRYVANQTGGFLGFWYHWVGASDCSLYIQIENAFDNGIKVVVKIGDWKPDTNRLYQILSELQPYARKHNLTIKKPDKYRAGGTSTLAIVQNPFSIHSDGNLDLEQFIQTLKKMELMLEEYSTEKENTTANIM